MGKLTRFIDTEEVSYAWRYRRHFRAPKWWREQRRAIRDAEARYQRTLRQLAWLIAEEEQRKNPTISGALTVMCYRAEADIVRQVKEQLFGLKPLKEWKGLKDVVES